MWPETSTFAKGVFLKSKKCLLLITNKINVYLVKISENPVKIGKIYASFVKN